MFFKHTMPHVPKRAIAPFLNHGYVIGSIKLISRMQAADQNGQSAAVDWFVEPLRLSKHTEIHWQAQFKEDLAQVKSSEIEN